MVNFWWLGMDFCLPHLVFEMEAGRMLLPNAWFLYPTSICVCFLVLEDMGFFFVRDVSCAPSFLTHWFLHLYLPLYLYIMRAFLWMDGTFSTKRGCYRATIMAFSYLPYRTNVVLRALRRRVRRTRHIATCRSVPNRPSL